VLPRCFDLYVSQSQRCLVKILNKAMKRRRAKCDLREETVPNIRSNYQECVNSRDDQSEIKAVVKMAKKGHNPPNCLAIQGRGIRKMPYRSESTRGSNLFNMSDL